MRNNSLLHGFALPALGTILVILLALADIETATIPPLKPKKEYVRSVTLSFSGDLMQHMPQLTVAQNSDGSYDFSRTFSYIDTVWKSVDFAVINFETTISANGRYSGFPMFSSPPDVAYQLKESGIDVIGFANNHTCDRGRRGIEHTLSMLDSIGFKTTGAYADSTSAKEILMLNKGRFRVALLNYTYGTNGIPIPKGTVVNLIDTVKIKEDIQRAKTDSTATHIIAFMHWGEEYRRISNAEQRKIGLWCRTNGVDVVVGSHPHVVQEIDTMNRIVYSLGNFISNQQDRFTDSGITAIIELSMNANPKISYVPHWCDKIAQGKEKYRVLTSRDTLLYEGAERRRMQRALQDACMAAEKHALPFVPIPSKNKSL